MKKIVFANASYKKHMTDEGEQLQAGLASHGWELHGPGYPKSSNHTVAIIAHNKPDIVFVQDKRDWDKYSGGCFNKQSHFEMIHYLAQMNTIFKTTVLKDAASMLAYQRNFIENEVVPQVLVIYYHPQSIIKHNHWINPWIPKCIRTYHSVDKNVFQHFSIAKTKGGIVTGALGDVYPLRTMVSNNCKQLGIDVIEHPGYHANGCYTLKYLQLLSSYKVHVATSSRYGFALRKIIESVACECVCITDLPSYDVLPEIDDVLVRVEPNITMKQIADLIRYHIAHYDPEKMKYKAKKCREYYDYRHVYGLLDQEIVTQYKKWKGI